MSNSIIGKTLLGIELSIDGKYKFKEREKDDSESIITISNVKFLVKNDNLNFYKDIGDFMKIPVKLITNNNLFLVEKEFDVYFKKNEPLYKDYLLKKEEEKKENAKIEEKKEKFYKRIDGLKTEEIFIGELKFNNYDVQVYYNTQFFWEGIIFKIKDEYESTISIYDYYNSNYFNLSNTKEYLLKFNEWYDIALEKKTELNKEIGRLYLNISWLYYNDRYSSIDSTIGINCFAYYGIGQIRS